MTAEAIIRGDNGVIVGRRVIGHAMAGIAVHIGTGNTQTDGIGHVGVGVAVTGGTLQTMIVDMFHHHVIGMTVNAVSGTNHCVIVGAGMINNPVAGLAIHICPCSAGGNGSNHQRVTIFVTGVAM